MLSKARRFSHHKILMGLTELGSVSWCAEGGGGVYINATPNVIKWQVLNYYTCPRVGAPTLHCNISSLPHAVRSI